MIWKLFGSALAIRWAYALVMYFSLGETGLKGEDSYGYASVAQLFADAVASGSMSGWQWLGSNTVMMPLFNALLALSDLLFGHFGILAYVLLQGVCDAAACVLVYLIARDIRPECAAAAGIVAAINPTQIVMSGLYYPDTIFVFFLSLSLLGTVRWLRLPTAGSTALIAIGLACATLYRVLVLPWVAVLIVILFAHAAFRSRLTAATTVKLGSIAIVVGLCAGVVLARNVAVYGAWQLTSQGGRHLQYVVPWVGQAFDGTPWAAGEKKLIDDTTARYPEPARNVFDESNRQTKVAMEAWRGFGLLPTAKAWLYGAAINMASPGIILSPPLLQIPRTGFYSTPGNSMIEKVKNFLFNGKSGVYTWALLIGGLGVFLVRMMQLVGAGSLIKAAWRDRSTAMPVALVMGLWCCFILATNGPVASPKYRLPLEPLLNVLTGLGLTALRRSKS
jgi:4-amino-4-deoxy-L-arabinose transferase-like glycosyltransferase